MRASYLLACAVLLTFSASAKAQILHDYPAGGDLGYWDWTQPMAEALALTDTTIVLPVAGVHAHPDRPAAGLQVLRHLHGIVLVDFVPIPGQLLDPDGIWHQPYRLDDESLIMPGPGFDGVYATADDELIFVSGLQNPGAATVQAISLGTAGPTRDARLWIDSARRVFYFQGYLDGPHALGDQTIVVVNEIGGPGQNVQTLFVPTIDQTGAAPFFVQLDSGWVFPMTGRDGSFRTDDDELGFLTFSPSGLPMNTVYAAGYPLHMPEDSSWPRRVGPDAIIFATHGSESGSHDDELIRIYDFSTAFTVRPTSIGNSVALQTLTGNTPCHVDADGTLFTTDSGPDQIWGSVDDVVEVHSAQGVALLNCGMALGFQAEANPLAPQSLSATVTLLAHHGSSAFNYADKGIAAVVETAPGVYSMTPYLLFDEVLSIVPMDETSAMVFTASGASHYFTGFGGPTLIQNLVSANGWDGISTPKRMSPAMVATFAAGTPTPTYLVEDSLRLHKVPKAFSYGEASPNGAGYSLEIGVGTNQPYLGGSAYEVTLTDAPPAEPAILMVSLGRDHLEVLPGVFLLVEPESVLHLFNWGTLPSGSTSFSLLPPSNPLFQGIAGHFQWLVWDSAAPRGFQFSKGLTIAF